MKAKSWLKWDKLSPATAASLEESFRNLGWMLSKPYLDIVATDMIDNFMGGSGSTYSHPILTTSVSAHESTKKYINSATPCIKELISSYDGKISSLRYVAATRKYHPLVIMLRKKNILQPQYTTNDDLMNGLAFCLHGLWGNQIEITSYKKSGNSYSGKLLFTLYDHFGLDQKDVENLSNIITDIFDLPIEGFSAWYILQHNKAYKKAYKPFITRIELEVPFSGTI